MIITLFQLFWEEVYGFYNSLVVVYPQLPVNLFPWIPSFGATNTQIFPELYDIFNSPASHSIHHTAVFHPHTVKFFKRTIYTFHSLLSITTLSFHLHVAIEIVLTKVINGLGTQIQIQ